MATYKYLLSYPKAFFFNFSLSHFLNYDRKVLGICTVEIVYSDNIY